jgi:hypothetical protein
MKKLAMAFVMGGSILAFAPIAAPQLSGHVAQAQRCGSSYVICERRNPGKFWGILSSRQQQKALRKRKRPQ